MKDQKVKTGRSADRWGRHNQQKGDSIISTPLAQVFEVFTRAHTPCCGLTFRCSMTLSLIHHRGKNHMLKYRDICRWRLDRTRLSESNKTQQSLRGLAGRAIRLLANSKTSRVNIGANVSVTGYLEAQTRHSLRRRAGSDSAQRARSERSLPGVSGECRPVPWRGTPSAAATHREQEDAAPLPRCVVSLETAQISRSAQISHEKFSSRFLCQLPRLPNRLL